VAEEERSPVIALGSRDPSSDMNAVELETLKENSLNTDSNADIAFGFFYFHFPKF
jgi:hypothetical protein